MEMKLWKPKSVCAVLEGLKLTALNAPIAGQMIINLNLENVHLY
jgi:hypothetical protein